MYNSINHPWAIGDKQRQRYGDAWADMDFVFHEQIINDTFKWVSRKRLGLRNHLGK